MKNRGVRNGTSSRRGQLIMNQRLVDMFDLVVTAHKRASANGVLARWACHKLNGALRQLLALLDLARAQLALGDGAKRSRSGSHVNRSLGRLGYARLLGVNMEKNRCCAKMPAGVLQLLGFPCLLLLPGHSRSANFGSMQLKGYPRLAFSNQMEPVVDLSEREERYWRKAAEHSAHGRAVAICLRVRDR